MGGYGSSRWLWHNRKTQVEECLKFSIFSMKDYLKPGFRGASTWYRGEKKVASISYQVLGEDTPTSVRFMYSYTEHNGEKKNLDYSVQLTTTSLVWGGERFWFVCPLVVNNIACRRRVGCLYLPPYGEYFGCRHCYNLTYRSSQESGQFRSLYESLAASMQYTYPGITGRDVRYMLEDKYTPHLEEIVLKKFVNNWEPPPDPYDDYLTADELCRQSGLPIEDLKRLEEIRLLVPDTSDGRYRPKLVGWAQKLAYLLEHNWSLWEIKAWAKGRWHTPNPRQWPPDREIWQF